MLLVPLERDHVGDLAWQGADGDVQPERPESPDHLVIEVGNGARLEPERLHRPLARLDPELVIEKVECDLEGA